jgi:hypothetical protein
MIELLATIDLGENYKYTAEVVSAKSNVADENGNTENLSFPYIGTLYSWQNKLFGREYEAKSVTHNWSSPNKAEYPPKWFFRGRLEYNGDLCVWISVGYEIKVWNEEEGDIYQSYKANNISFSPVNAYVVPSVNGNYKYFRANGIEVLESIGLNLDIYIPVQNVQNGQEPPYFIPELVSMNYTISRDNVSLDPYKITIQTDKPCNCLSISFGETSIYHPTKVAIDGKSFAVKGATAEFKNLSFSSEHEIVVFDWTYAYRPLYIGAISASFDGIMEIGKSKMLSCGSSIIDRGDTALPSFGIISNGGNLSFSDYDDSVLQMAQIGFLGEGANAQIFLADKLNGIKKVVGDFYTDTWSYDNNAKSVSVSLKDDLEELQDIVFEGLEYNFETRETKTAKQIYEFLYGKTPEKFVFVPFDSLSASTKSVLEKTIVQFPYLEKGNLWSAWVKLCELCQLYIFKEYGITKCEYRGGS